MVGESERMFSALVVCSRSSVSLFAPSLPEVAILSDSHLPGAGRDLHRRERISPWGNAKSVFFLSRWDEIAGPCRDISVIGVHLACKYARRFWETVVNLVLELRPLVRQLSLHSACVSSG